MHLSQGLKDVSTSALKKYNDNNDAIGNLNNIAISFCCLIFRQY